MDYLMNLLNFGYTMVDFFPRLINKIKLSLGSYSVFSSTSKSDSDSTPYTKYVEKVISNQKKFSKFRRNFSYRLILEHVDYKLGKDYLRKLSSESLECYLDSKTLAKLSEVGNPRKYYFKNLGWISPTVLRYLFVNQNLNHLFDTQKISSVGEIGVGFGGQLTVSLEILNLNHYAIYDLPPVAALTKQVLAYLKVDTSIVSVEEIDPPAPVSYDLVISNYAFSELPYEVQLNYLVSIFKNSKRGYLTMNSGRGNESGRSDGKMQLTEIKKLIPEIEVIEENPLTGPDNYILVWGVGT